MASAVVPGQTWTDTDKRVIGRRIRIDRIDGDYAVCTIVAEGPQNKKARGRWLRPDGWTSVGRETRILLRRFRPTSTGYRLAGGWPVMLPKTERLRSPRHLAWVRTLPCAVPGCKGCDVQAHHIRKAAGVGLKPADQYSAPLCLEHHVEGHAIGWRSFEIKHGVDLSAIAPGLWRESNQQRKVEG